MVNSKVLEIKIIANASGWRVAWRERFLTEANLTTDARSPILLNLLPSYRAQLDRRLALLDEAGRRQVDLLARMRPRRSQGSLRQDDLVPLLLSINCVACGLGWTG